MDIIVIGTWDPATAGVYSHQAKMLGEELARRDHRLIAAPSAGIQGLVASAYKRAGGPEFIGWFPDLDTMRKIGEECLVMPDKPVYTGEDYPVRNVLQLRSAEGIIALTGGTGTLTETIMGVFDYHLPYAYYGGSSPTLDAFLSVHEGFSKKAFVSKDIAALVDHVELARKE